MSNKIFPGRSALAALSALALAAAAPSTAVAQDADGPDRAPPSVPAPEAAPAPAPTEGPEANLEEEEALSPEERLERAFTRLASEDEQEWRDAQEEIVQAWSKSGSPSADLLLQRGRAAMEREAFDEALAHFNDLVNLAPEFAEGWNMRATLHFQRDDYGASLADIAETLAREPRHFGALAGLGVILDALDEDGEAVKAFRRALEVHPNLEAAHEAVKRLAPNADGRDA